MLSRITMIIVAMIYLISLGHKVEAQVSDPVVQGFRFMTESENQYYGRAEGQTEVIVESYDIQVKLVKGLDLEGRARKMEMHSWVYNFQGLQNSQLLVTNPAISRKGIMTIQSRQSTDEQVVTFQTIYSQSLGLNKIAAGSDAKKTLFISRADITVGDLEPEDLPSMTYTAQPYEELNNRTCLVVIATPNDSADIDVYGYSSRKIWIRHSTKMIVRIEYYDQNGNLEKIQENSDWERDVTGYWRAGTITVTSQRNKRITIMTFSNRQINQPLPENRSTEEFFTERSLVRMVGSQ